MFIASRYQKVFNCSLLKLGRKLKFFSFKKNILSVWGGKLINVCEISNEQLKQNYNSAHLKVLVLS